MFSDFVNCSPQTLAEILKVKYGLKSRKAIGRFAAGRLPEGYRNAAALETVLFRILSNAKSNGQVQEHTFSLYKIE